MAFRLTDADREKLAVTLSEYAQRAIENLDDYRHAIDILAAMWPEQQAPAPAPAPGQVPSCFCTCKHHVGDHGQLGCTASCPGRSGIFNKLCCCECYIDSATGQSLDAVLRFIAEHGTDLCPREA